MKRQQDRSKPFTESTGATAQECDRPRRGAVDREILSYLGNLARRDPESFVYPSFSRIAEKIRRSPHYVKQRVVYLERIGRLIPTERKKFGREISGWIVLPYKQWVEAQHRQAEAVEEASRKEANNSKEVPNNFPKGANNLGSPLPPGLDKDLHLQEDKGTITRRNPSQPNPTYETAGRRRSLRENATATRSGKSRNPSEKERTFRERLANAVRKRSWPLSEVLKENLKRGVQPEWLEETLRVTSFLGYDLDLDDPVVTHEFCDALILVFEEEGERLRLGELKLSAFCSRIIDRCRKQYEIVWPPSFTQHRNRLRNAEQDGHLRMFSKETRGGGYEYTGVVPESLEGVGDNK